MQGSNDIQELRGALFFGAWNCILGKDLESPRDLNSLKQLIYVFSFSDMEGVINKVVEFSQYERPLILDNITLLSMTLADLATEVGDTGKIIQSIKNPEQWLKK